MKNSRILLVIFLFIMFFPFIVNAEGSCIFVSGGLDIGSEVACGQEHFYIVENNDNTVKMLSKYNLFVGSIFDKIVLDANKTYIKYECKDANSNWIINTEYYFENEQVENYNEWESRIKEKYNIDYLYGSMESIGSFSDGTSAYFTEEKGNKYEEDGKYYYKKTYKLYPTISIFENTNGYALQNRLALGVTGEKGNANYPIYATLDLFHAPEYLPDYYISDNLTDALYNFNSFETGYTNFDFKGTSPVTKYLNDYKSNLINMGFDILDVNMLTVKDINDLVQSITNENLPLVDWYNDSYGNESIIEDNNEYKTVGDLKEYLSNDYSWLWNTSYWLKTLVGNKDNNIWKAEDDSIYFISTEGEMCYSKVNCYSGIPRAGLRPVVTVGADSIKYNIYTQTDGNGTIEVVDSASGGETISFTVTAETGQTLTGITITTESGETIEFSEEDITQNNDGTYTISTSTFTMPYESVTIEAKWEEVINPKTGVSNYVLFLLLIIILSILFNYKLNKKLKYYNNL